MGQWKSKRGYGSDEVADILDRAFAEIGLLYIETEERPGLRRYRITDLADAIEFSTKGILKVEVSREETGGVIQFAERYLHNVDVFDLGSGLIETIPNRGQMQVEAVKPPDEGSAETAWEKNKECSRRHEAEKEQVVHSLPDDEGSADRTWEGDGSWEEEACTKQIESGLRGAFDSVLNLCQKQIKLANGSSNNDIRKARMDNIYRYLRIATEIGYDGLEQKHRYEDIKASFCESAHVYGLIYDCDCLA